MKRRIIFVVLILVIIACTMLLMYILPAYDVGDDMNEEENDTESMNNQNTQNSSNRSATLEDIMQTKKDIEQSLNDNYEIFNQIIMCFENDAVNYICGQESGEIVIEIICEDKPGSQRIDSGEVEVAEQIAYVINDLDFVGIVEADDYVCFEKQTGVYLTFGTYIQELYCNKSTANEKKIQEGYSSLWNECVHIRDDWFYVISSMNEGPSSTSTP